MINFIVPIKAIFSKTQDKLGKVLLEKGLQVRTAESCTGGLLSSRLTDVSGSSGYIRCNFVTYSNQSKSIILGVSEELIEKYGAVSEEVARDMAERLAEKTGCDLAICTTGIAGPLGGSKEKPVGTIYISVFYKGEVHVCRFNLSPKLNRRNMKWMFSEKALQMALEIVENSP